MRFLSLARLVWYGFLLPDMTSAAAAQDPKNFKFVPFNTLEKRDVPSKCNADNCARAATGTRGCSGPTRLASCASFMRCTVTPVPLTVTDTITETLEPTTEVVIVTVTPGADPAKRAVDGAATPVTNCPTSVPTFATACSGTVRYSSACACGGFTMTYTTIDPATTTVTTTVTETPDKVVVTSTAGPPPYTPAPRPTGAFSLRVVGGQYDGLRAVGSTGSTLPGWIWWAHLNTGGSYLEIDASGILTENNFAAVRQLSGEQGGELGVPYNQAATGWTTVTWTTWSNDGGATLYLTPAGSNPAHTRLQVCPRDSAHSLTAWFWLGSAIRSGCTEVHRLQVGGL